MAKVYVLVLMLSTRPSCRARVVTRACGGACSGAPLQQRAARADLGTRQCRRTALPAACGEKVSARPLSHAGGAWRFWQQLSEGAATDEKMRWGKAST
eukprot:2241147-Pleurochrysis_carterae.AAC.2